MKWLFKYSLKGITVLLFGYLLILSLVRNTIYLNQEMPIATSFFTYALFGFWSGMFFMSFLYRNGRKN